MLCYLFVNEKEIYQFKADNKNIKFPTQFCLGIISNGCAHIDSRDISLKKSVHDFSVDYNAINKSNILNICKYLKVKNNIK